MPNMERMMSEGSFTYNARTDKDYTITLPNHVGMFYGVPVKIHGVTFNSSDRARGTTVSRESGMKLSSIFENVKDSDGRPSSAMYVEKEKLGMINKSNEDGKGASREKYVDEEGDVRDGLPMDHIPQFCLMRGSSSSTFPDFNSSVGRLLLDLQLGLGVIDTSLYFEEDRGLQPIDRISKDQLTSLLSMAGKKPDGIRLYRFSFCHISKPDSVGHKYGWHTPEYYNALVEVDNHLGYLMGYIRSYHQWVVDNGIDKKSRIHVALTSDHGGGVAASFMDSVTFVSPCDTITDKHHNMPDCPINFTIMMVLWNGLEFESRDLYESSRLSIEKLIREKLADQPKEIIDSLRESIPVPPVITNGDRYPDLDPPDTYNPKINRVYNPTKQPIRNLDLAAIIANATGSIPVGICGVHWVHDKEGNPELGIPTIRFPSQ